MAITSESLCADRKKIKNSKDLEETIRWLHTPIMGSQEESDETKREGRRLSEKLMS
jgi:hypothetical protein